MKCSCGRECYKYHIRSVNGELTEMCTACFNGQVSSLYSTKPILIESKISKDFVYISPAELHYMRSKSNIKRK